MGKRLRAAEDAGGVSIAEVAARAGVSIATVSRVLNKVANKASPETIARVRRAALELDYRPLGAGQALRQRRSRLVALLAANLANPAMAAVAASAEIALRQRGLVMILCDTHDRADLQDEYLREMRAQQVRATVLLGAVASPQLDALRAAGAPLVFVNRRDPGGGPLPFIGIDNAAAGRDVAAFCLAQGYRRPALVHAALTSSATRERVQALREALAAGGAPVAGQHVHAGSGIDHLAIGYEGAARLAQAAEPADVVICASDLIAFGAGRRLREGGGEWQPRLVGFDDSPMNEWVAPWLTSVRIPYDAFGPAIAEFVAGEGARAAEILLPHRLEVRH